MNMSMSKESINDCIVCSGAMPTKFEIHQGELGTDYVRYRAYQGGGSMSSGHLTLRAAQSSLCNGLSIGNGYIKEMLPLVDEFGNKRSVHKFVVTAKNSQDNNDFCIVKVIATQQQVDNEEADEVVIKYAEENGYKPGLIYTSACEGSAVLDLLDWDEVTTLVAR